MIWTAQIQVLAPSSGLLILAMLSSTSPSSSSVATRMSSQRERSGLIQCPNIFPTSNHGEIHEKEHETIQGTCNYAFEG